MRRRPEDYGLLPDGRQPAHDVQVGEVSDEAGEELWSLAEAKRTVTLWALIVAQAAVVLAVNATNLPHQCEPAGQGFVAVFGGDGGDDLPDRGGALRVRLGDC